MIGRIALVLLLVGLLMGPPGRARSVTAPSYSIRELPGLGGTFVAVRGINAAGQAVGASSLAHRHGTRAVLWAARGALDLGTLGGPFSSGQAINAPGQVVAAETALRRLVA
jgi:probable HAF family extracellular repeat protein